MLKNLYIKSFVLIDEVNIDFYHGMNVLTGETGSGKSIIIDAIGQLSGDRSNVSFIKHGANKAIIEGIFDNPNSKLLSQICNENHIEEDESFWIQKVIYDTGKSSIKINDTTVTNRTLRLIVPMLIDIHSQFDTGRSFEVNNHIHLLDQYASNVLLLDEYQENYNEYVHLKHKLDTALKEELSDEQLEYIESQIKEIDDYYYTDQEVDEFNDELKVLENYEKLNEKIKEFDQLMSNEQGVISLLKQSTDILDSINNVDLFTESNEKLTDYYYSINDIYSNIIRSFKSLSFDEYRYNELSEILFNVNKLKRKYGMNMDRVLETKAVLEQKVELIKNRDQYISDLKDEINKYHLICDDIATKLSTIRKDKANEFENNITNDLVNLYLENASIKIDIKEVELNKYGKDQVVFTVSMNKGQDYTPLNESASGGEIARLMLVIKTLIADKTNVDTIVFDEIDTGVSGKVASSIGKYMSQLSKKLQLICITHLPQVAVHADYHYLITKNDNEHETISTINLLNDDNRIIEIAKMLSNENVTEEAINNAKILLMTN